MKKSLPDFSSMGGKLGFSAFASLFLHAFVLFGIAFKLPDVSRFSKLSQPLEIVLVNSKSKSAPEKTDILAQANLEGGGDTEQNLQAKTPLPVLREDKESSNVENATKRVERLEAEAQQMLTRMKASSLAKAPQPMHADTEDIAQKSLEIARLEAQIDKNAQMYQKRPRRSFIGASTKEYRFARYIEDWRIKVERIGTLNYPEAAKREQIYGDLQLYVCINSDGTLEKVELERSSHHAVLDEAAKRIVKLGAPYPPFPDNIKKDSDILCLTRTWMFTKSDELISK